VTAFRVTAQATQEGYQTGLPHSRNKTVFSYSVILVTPRALTLLSWFVVLMFIREPATEGRGKKAERGTTTAASTMPSWLPLLSDTVLKKTAAGAPRAV